MAGEEDVGNLAVKLAMDDSSFQQGLQSLKRNMSVIDSSFKDSIAGLKNWGKNVDALQSNASALGEKIELQRQVVEKYQEQLEKSKSNLENNSKAMLDLKSKVDEAKTAWQESAETEGKNTESTKQLKQAYDELNKQYSDSEQKVRNNAKTLDGYTIQVNNAESKLKSLESQLESTNKKIQTQSSSWTQAGEKLNSMSEGFKKAGEKLSDVGEGLTKYVSTPLAAAGVASIKFSNDFTDGLAKISTIADTTQMSISDIGNGVINLSDDTGKSVNDLNEGLYQAISSGIQTGDAVNFMGTATKTAVGGFSDAATAVDGLTTVINAYNFKSTDALSIANQMMVAQNLGKTTFDEMAKSIGLVADTTANMNVNTKDLFSSLAVMTAHGIDTSEAIQGLREALSNIIQPSDEASKMAQQLGLQFNAAHLKSVGWAEFLKEIEEKTHGNTTEMGALFGSIQGLNAMITLTSESGMSLFNQSLQQMSSNTDYVDEAFNKVNNTSGQNFKKSLNELKNSSIELGQALTPALNTLSGLFKGLAEGLNNLSPSQRQFVVNAGLMVAATGPLLSGIGKISIGLGAIESVLGKFSMAAGTATAAAKAGTAAAGATATAVEGATVATEGAGAAAATAAGAGGLGAFATGLGALALAAAPWVAGAAAIAGAGYGIYKAYKAATDDSIPKMDLFAAKVEQTSQRVQLGEGQTSESFKKQTTTISEETQKAVGAYVKLNDSVTKTEEDIQLNAYNLTTQTKNTVIKNFTDMVNQSGKLDSDMKTNKIKAFTDMVNNTNTLSVKNKTEIVNQYKQMLSQVGGLSDQQKQKLVKNFQDTLTNSVGITKQQVSQIKSQYDQMTQTIDSAVDKRTQHETKSMQDLFSKSTSISSKEQQTILTNITKSGDTQKQKISSMEQQILNIYQNAANNHRDLNSKEQQEVNQIQNNMEQNAVQTLSKSEVESKVILERLKDYNGNITTQQASDTIKNAEKARQGAVQSANDKYNQTVAAIIQERDGTHSISVDQADKLIAEAERQRKDSINKADDMKTGVVNKVEGMNKDVIKDIDTSTGNMLSPWQKLTKDIEKEWEGLKTWFSNTPIVATIEKSIKNASTSSIGSGNGLGGYSGFATGTDYAPPGWHWVGEEGAELLNFAGGEQVINAKDSKDIVEQMQNAGQAKTSNTTSSTASQMKNTQLYAENLNTSLGQGITNSVGLVTDPLNQLIAKLNTLMTNFANKYTGYGQQNVKNLGNGITQNAALVTTPLKTLTAKLGNNLNTFATGAINYGTQTNTSIGNGINNSADIVTNAQKGVTDTLDKNLDTFASNSINYGINTDTSIGSGINNNSNAIMSAGNKVTTTLGNNLNAFSTAAVKYGQTTDTSISSGISNTVGTVIGSANNLDSQLGSTFNAFAQGCSQYGLNAGNSIAEGMRQSEANAVSIAHELVQKILSAITGPDGFDEHSPSRKTTWAGEMAIDGLINGITSKDATEIFKNKIAPMLGAAGALGGNISEWILAGMMAEGAPMSWFLPLEMIASRESGDPGKLGTGNPSLVNGVGVGNEYATGLMQVLPSTFRSFFGSDAGIFNPVMSVRAAIREIRESWGGNPYSIPGLMGGGNYLGYASGTSNALPGWRIVGEKGPELEYSPVGGETILNNQDTMSLMNNNSGSNLVKGLADAINSKINMFKNAGESIGTNLIKGATDGVDKSLDVFKKAIDNIGNGISNALNPNKVTEGSLKDFQSWMPDFVSELAKGLKDNSIYINNSVLKLGTILADSVMPERSERTKYFNNYSKGAITADKAITELDSKIKMLKTTTGDYDIDVRNLLGAMTDQSTEVNILTEEYNKLAKQYGADSDKATAELKKIEDLRTAYQETGKAVKDLADKLKQSEISDLNDINDKLKEALKQQYEDEKQAAEDQINLTTDTQTKILQSKLDSLDIQYQDEDDSDKRAELERQLNMHYGAEKKKELQQELDDLNKDESRRHEKQALQDQIDDLKDNNDKMIKNIDEFYSDKLKDANIDAEAQKMLVDNNQKEIVSLLKSYGKDYELAGTSLGDRLVDGLKNSLAVIPSMIDSIKSQINSLKDDMSSLNMSSSDNNVSGSSTQQNTVANSSRSVIENHLHLYVDGKEVAAATTPYSNSIQGSKFALAQRGLR